MEFFGPLKGKSVTFLVGDRPSNLALSRAVMGLLASIRCRGEVLDLDALYASNSDQIFGSVSALEAQGIRLRVPDPGSKVEVELPRLLGGAAPVMVVDSLNSLYHLLSAEDGVFRSRKLSFAVAALSYAARTNGGTAVLTMYRREGFPRRGPGRSISGLSDLTVEAEASGSALTLTCRRGSAWTGGSFSIRSP